MGKLLGIAIRERSRSPMKLLETCELTPESGLTEDFRGRPGKRQVTVMTREGWEAAGRELGQELEWTTRRANLLVEGVELADTEGRTLRIGGLELEITMECDPCERMEEQRAGLRDARTPDWRAGVTCRVTRGATLRLGDEVELGS